MSAVTETGSPSQPLPVVTDDDRYYLVVATDGNMYVRCQMHGGFTGSVVGAAASMRRIRDIILGHETAHNHAFGPPVPDAPSPETVTAPNPEEMGQHFRSDERP